MPVIHHYIVTQYKDVVLGNSKHKTYSIPTKQSSNEESQEEISCSYVLSLQVVVRHPPLLHCCRAAHDFKYVVCLVQ